MVQEKGLKSCSWGKKVDDGTSRKPNLQKRETMETKNRKLVAIGDCCGKSCLLRVFSEGCFPHDEMSLTVFENYVASVETPKAKVELALWDTASQEDYDHIRSLSYSGTDVLLICFAVDWFDSFDNIRHDKVSSFPKIADPPSLQ